MKLISTDFTDCPHTALLYARGKRGVVLVVDIPADTTRVTEELWLAGPARRLMIWGEFDRFIVAILLRDPPTRRIEGADHLVSNTST
jgi:hypothetical protein